MCQSEATPSSALYWHMGETTTRFASSRSASRIGENRALVMSHASIGEREEVGRGRPYRRPPGGSSCRATGGFGGEAGLLREDFVLRTRRDRGPALAQMDGLAHAIEELPLRVIVLPAPALIKFYKMCTPTLGKRAPLLRDRIECLCGRPCRHGKAVACRWSRRVI